ncbi:hypothetical protein LMH73_015875 [Vibrio splendidus]|nr:hypothetical protein [Vibrio splendidus]MCC4881457.1 hypothetical protein [Vibrio splendidus]
MNKIKLCALAIPMMLSANAFASSKDFSNPFINMDTEIVDISHDYIQGKLNVGEDYKALSITGSKSLNRMMFVDLKASYAFEGNADAKSLEAGFGLNYPLPIPVDVMVMDLYAKGFASYSEGIYTIDDKSYEGSIPSIGAIGGIKSNFGSDLVLLNLYGGMEWISPDDISNKAEDETKMELVYGAELEFMVGRQTSVILGGEYRFDEYSFNTALRYSF